MELYLLLHSVVMHAIAALVILVYIPVCVPARLLARALVRPRRKEDLRGKVVLITGASSGIGEVSVSVICMMSPILAACCIWLVEQMIC
jgi:FlaA1/EpsC-like NDP-sugar epimerase